MGNFWIALKQPFTILAPMDGVTDTVFRQVINKIGRPDVFFTEFVNTDGLVSEQGSKAVSERLLFEKSEKPVVAQIWGTNPDHFYKSAKLLEKMGFAGVDINMGCPDREITKRGSCSALIKNRSLAAEIIDATKKGAGKLPVSVKTRLGWDKEQIDEWISFLLEQEISALTVHLRTVSEMSKVDAHWDLMPKIMGLRDKTAPNTLIIGNGDIMSAQEISQKYSLYKCDGFMVGRGIFHDPWMFNKSVNSLDMSPQQRVELFKRHIELFEQTWGEAKNPATLKKFAKTYINNFPNSSSLREAIMETKTLEELKISVSQIRLP